MFSHMLVAVPLLFFRPVCSTEETPTHQRSCRRLTPTPTCRTTPSHQAKSAAKVKISSQTLLQDLKFNAYINNTNPGAFDDDDNNNNGHDKSEGRRIRTFSSCENDMKLASPPGHAVKLTFATPPFADRNVSSRAGQDKENNSPVGNLCDETVVSPGQEPKVNFMDVNRTITVGLAGIRAGLTPLRESQKSWKRQMNQVLRKLPQEYGKRDMLRTERAFWKGKMLRVFELVDVEFFGNDWVFWKRLVDQFLSELPQEFVKRDKLRMERAFWKGKMSRVLEGVDVEFFGDDWAIRFPLH
jgi:hypothetical protein